MPKSRALPRHWRTRCGAANAEAIKQNTNVEFILSPPGWTGRYVGTGLPIPAGRYQEGGYRATLVAAPGGTATITFNSLGGIEIVNADTTAPFEQVDISVTGAARPLRVVRGLGISTSIRVLRSEVRVARRPERLSMTRARYRQQGSFLLEALIAILIVALGVLGSVGLLARSMQDMDDAKNRGEAAYLANQLISQMWLSDRVTANLDTEFGSATRNRDRVRQLQDPGRATTAQRRQVRSGGDRRGGAQCGQSCELPRDGHRSAGAPPANGPAPAVAQRNPRTASTGTSSPRR